MLYKKSPTILERITSIQIFQRKIIDESYKQETFNNKLTRSLINHHSPDKFNLIKYYHLNLNDIIHGVMCANCSFSPMHKSYKVWRCSNCQNTEKNPIPAALRIISYLGLEIHLLIKNFENTYVSSRLLWLQNC